MKQKSLFIYSLVISALIIIAVPGYKSFTVDNSNQKPPKVIKQEATNEVPQLKPESEFITDSQQICSAKWTKRGVLDRRMYDFCIITQMEKFEKLVNLHSQYGSQNFYSKIAFPFCSEKWTKRGVSNAEMMEFCLNKEVDGMKDVMYYRKTYGESEVDAIVDTALATYKSWEMSAFEVKNHFEN